MADERKTSNWWQTMPGALTAVAAFLAAISGLLGGLNQIGVFDRFKHPATPPPVTGSLSRPDTARKGETPTTRRSASAPVRRAPTPSTQRPARPPAAAESSRARTPAGSTATAAPPGAAPADSAASRRADSIAHRPADTAAAQPASNPGAGQPTAAPRDTSKAPAPAPAAVVPSGTQLELAAQSRVCSTTNKPGEHFAASVVVPVTGPTGILVPSGSTAIMEVTEEGPPAFLGAKADSLIVNGKAHPITASSTGRLQREFVAGPGERGVSVGACIPTGGRIPVTLTAPVPLNP